MASQPAAACHPHAARTMAPQGVVRRRPETTVLYQVVQQNLETFLADARERSEHGFGLPRYVEREFERYLECGILAHGFCRIRCEACGHEELLAFSCKGRGFCPCCTGRRMADTAAHLVDRVLPTAPYRQWTLSFPFRLRFRLARDPDLVSAVLGIFLAAVFAWQRRRARRQGFRGQPGAVTFVQRFGGLAANLNVHFHSIVPDGLFERDAQGAWRLRPLEPPTDEEVAAITRRIVRRVTRRLARKTSDEESVPDALAAVQAAALQAPLPFASRPDPPPARRDSGRRCALVDGFSLHANTHVGTHDRLGLERLLRYAGRNPIALSRMSFTPDGQVAFRLKRPAPGGATTLTLAPLALMRRLAALVPPPRRHQLRYAGAFAPNCACRADIVPAAPAEPGEGVAAASAAPGAPDPAAPRVPASVLARRLEWAALLARVFEQDVLRCPRCGGRRRVIAFLTDPDVVHRILRHLGLPTTPPEVAPARAPPQTDSAGWFDADFVDP